jgi:hypothetical protein
MYIQPNARIIIKRYQSERKGEENERKWGRENEIEMIPDCLPFRV